VKKFVVEANRLEKARKIKTVLEDFLGEPIKNKRILDIGTGNGEIADFFSIKNKVNSTDVLDQRKNKHSGTIFRLVKSERLPFKDGSFDVVISNHIIEHVKNQKLHLSEIKRVLKQKGVCYLATPNRLFPWETHYNVWFIHYLPKRIFHKILKHIKKYKEDINLATYPELKREMSKFFEYFEYTHKVIKENKKYHVKIPLLNRLPLRLLKMLNFISQTNIFILKKREE